MENEIMNNEMVMDGVAEVATKVDFKKGIIMGLVAAGITGLVVLGVKKLKKKRLEKKAKLIEGEFEETVVEENDSEEI